MGPNASSATATGSKRKAPSVESTRIQDQPRPTGAQVKPFNELKDMIGITLRDAVLLRKIREQMTKNEQDLDWDTVNKINKYYSDGWAKLRPRVINVWDDIVGLSVSNMVKQMRNILPSRVSMLYPGRLGTSDPKEFADRASKMNQSLLDIAGLAVEWTPLEKASTTKKSKSSTKVEPDPVYLTSVSSKHSPPLIIDKKTYISGGGVLPNCEQLILLQLIARLFAVVACNSEFLMATNRPKASARFVFLRSLFTAKEFGGPTLALEDILSHADMGVPEPFQDRESLKQAFKVVDLNEDWEILTDSGNQLFDSLLSAIFSLPELKFSADTSS